MPRKFYFAAAVALLLAGVFVFRSWLEAHDDRTHMQATIAAQQQLIAAADQRERQNAANLQATLAEIAALKRQVQTPQQILRDLPQYLPLPQPITLAPPASAAAGQGTALPGNSGPSAASGAAPGSASGTGAGADSSSAAAPAVPVAQIPTADLKPLFDFVQDCRACKVQLDAARADLKDEQAKTAALSKERDAAVKAVKGGGFWTRVKRNAKWLAIGAILGVAAAHAAP
jgi:hypothetical protein